MQDIVDYYVQYGDALRTMQLAGSVGAMFLLVFLLGLGAYLRRLQDRRSPLTAGVVTAGVAGVAMILIANAASLLIVLNAGRVDDTARRRLLQDFAKTTDVLTSLPIAAVVAFTSGILVRGQRASRWIGLTGCPIVASSRSVPWRRVGRPRYPAHLFPRLVRGACDQHGGARVAGCHVRGGPRLVTRSLQFIDSAPRSRALKLLRTTV